MGWSLLNQFLFFLCRFCWKVQAWGPSIYLWKGNFCCAFPGVPMLLELSPCLFSIFNLLKWLFCYWNSKSWALKRQSKKALVPNEKSKLFQWKREENSITFPHQSGLEREDLRDWGGLCWNWVETLILCSGFGLPI